MGGASPEGNGIELIIAEIYRIDELELYRKLQEAVVSKTTVRVVLDTPMLREPHSNLDIADEYYTALIFAELIAPFCAEIDWGWASGECGVVAIIFTVTPSDTKGLSQELAWYSQIQRRYLEPDDDSWVPAYPNGDEFENLRGFNGDMDANVHRFNDLAEIYVRNLQVGLGELYNGKELQDVYDELRVAYKRWWGPSLETRPLNIDLSLLAEGMTETEVSDISGGEFSYMRSELVNGSRVHIVDYQDADSKEVACRLWFLNGGLVTWSTGALANAEINLRSPNAPDFGKKLQAHQEPAKCPKGAES